MSRLATVGALILVLAGVASADVLVTADYGFGGQAVCSAITPVSVRVKSMESSPLGVRVEANYVAGRIGGEDWSTFDSLSPSGEKVFRFYGRAARRSTPKIALSFDRDVAVVQPNGRRFAPSDRFEIDLPELPGADEDSPAYMQILAAGPQASLLPRIDNPIRIMPIQEADLPEVWYAYDGVDVVLLRNPGEEEPLEPAVQDALLGWVEAGGRLVVSATRRPDLIADTPLGRALPATIGAPVEGGVDYGRLASELAVRARRNDVDQPGPLVALNPAPGANSWPIRSLGGRQTVLWAESRYGLGSIIVFAFDSSRLTAVSDPEADALYNLILRPPPRPADPARVLDDLFGDFRDYDLLDAGHDYPVGLDRLLKTGSLKRPPMLLLSLFMILYVLAIGPFDYVFLKRRRKLSWSAASLIVFAVGFSALAWFTSFYMFAGSARVNRFSFVDVVPRPGGSGTDNVIVNDIAGHYEPRGGTVELAPDPWDTAVFSPLAAPEAYFQWSGGLPGETFATRPIRAGASTSSFRVPFRSVRGCRALLQREETFPLEVRFLTGESVSVRSDLECELRDAHLLSMENGSLRICRLGVIPAGATRDYHWKEVTPSKFAADTELTDANTWTPQLLDYPDAALPRLGRTLMGLTLSGPMGGVSSAECGPVTEKLLRKVGIDRTAPLRSGASLLLAWSSAADPLRPGSSEGDGFTITVLRRWIEP